MKRAFEHSVLFSLVIACAITLGMPALSIAQTSISETTAIILTLTKSPQSPAPNEQVALTLGSYTTGLSAATIAWYVDGVLVSKGVGQTTFSTPSGKAGTIHTVRASATTPDGKTAEVRTEIRPTTVSLLFEGVTYTPPLYRGRALPSADAPIRIHADAQFTSSGGATISTNNITYTWTVNNRVMQNLSGVGKSDLVLGGPSLYGTLVVSVEAQAGAVHGSQSIRIPAVTPKIVLYHDDPLLGIQYHNAVNSGAHLEGARTTFVAEPYFFAVSSPVSSDLIYKWGVNGTPVLSDKRSPSRLTLNVEGGGESTATVSLALSNKQFSFQDTKQTWQVHITQTGSASTPFTNTQ